MLLLGINRRKIWIVRTQVHPEIHVVDRESKRLRQLRKRPNVFRAIQKLRKTLLEIVVARHHIEDAVVGFVDLPRPWKRLTSGEHAGGTQQLRLLVGNAQLLQY